MDHIRETGSIDLLNVIVHVIDHINDTQAQKSAAELDVFELPSKVKHFIHEHIRLSVQNNASRLARYTTKASVVQSLVNEILADPKPHFVTNSQHIADALFKTTPKTATVGCLIIAVYTNSYETFIAVIKLDKQDSVGFKLTPRGAIELVLTGNALSMPDKKSKLHKLAVLRNTDLISEEDQTIKAGILILDKQVAGFAQFFYKDFLESEFLMSDAVKSEKLIIGLNKYLKTVDELDMVSSLKILQDYANKITSKQEFTIDDSAEQIFSPYFKDKPERLAQVIGGLESALLREGIGDNNLRGEMTAKLEKMLGTTKIKTSEKIYLSIPTEVFETKVEIKDAENGDGSDIIIRNVHIQE